MRKVVVTVSLQLDQRNFESSERWYMHGTARRVCHGPTMAHIRVLSPEFYAPDMPLTVIQMHVLPKGFFLNHYNNMWGFSPVSRWSMHWACYSTVTIFWLLQPYFGNLSCMPVVCVTHYGIYRLSMHWACYTLQQYFGYFNHILVISVACLLCV